MEFWDSRNEAKHTASFPERPLGIEFFDSAPVVVKAVVPGSIAARAGVQRDMLLRAINGVSVAGRTLGDVQELLWRIAQKLPSTAS